MWFTSDLHFGHRLVAGHRGFESIEEHDAAIVANWLKDVGPKDQVWVLGDLAVSSPKVALATIAGLPGEKHLIAGNHDGCHPMHRDAHRRVGAYLEVFASVQSAARKRIAGVEVLLSHFPYERDRGEARYTQWRLPNQGSWLLHGHTHGTERVTQRRGIDYMCVPPLNEIHVGLDAWDMRLVSSSTIEREITADLTAVPTIRGSQREEGKA